METKSVNVSGTKGQAPSSSGASTNTEIFTLEDQSAKWGGIKLWTATMDLPGEKVNKLDERVMREFETMFPNLLKMWEEKKIDALLIQSSKPKIFIAGADIKMIQGAKTAKEASDLSKMGQDFLNQWEDLPFPTIVGINGAALGGGCEFSLASTAIIMSDDSSAKIGLPEVMLGVIPGMGGCVRLPQRVGIANAFDMILTGKQLNGKRAHRMGLADACLAKEAFSENTQQWIVKNLSKLKAKLKANVVLGLEPRLGGVGGKVGSFIESMTPFVVFNKARSTVLEKSRGLYPAPLEAIAVIKETGTGYGKRIRGKARKKAMDREAEGFGKCAETDISKNMIRLFYLIEENKKANGLPTGAPKPENTKVINAGVLGAGVMGGGIAQLFANKNIVVRMKDINSQGLETGMKAASKLFEVAMKRRRITKREYLQKLNHIAPVLDFSGYKSLDFVVEAVVENMDIKKKVFADLENHVSDDCVIASNTSSLSISEMATALKKPERFAGMHFFNPVHKMLLVEVIRGEKSSDRAVATVFELTKKMGKYPVVVKDAPGFLVNRLLAPYLNEATYILGDGASIEEIDEAMLDFGMPMGPMELIDEVGVDVGAKVATILHKAFGDRMVPAPHNPKVVESGRLGKKTGKGLYEYSGQGNRNKEVNPEIYDVVGLLHPKKGAVSAEEIVERCVLPMINEVSRCLDEGVVATPGEVDLAMVFGTGFAPFRGGLLRYADTVGADKVVEKLQKYEKRFGARYAPAAPLIARANENQSFYND